MWCDDCRIAGNPPDCTQERRQIEEQLPTINFVGPWTVTAQDQRLAGGLGPTAVRPHHDPASLSPRSTHARHACIWPTGRETAPAPPSARPGADWTAACGLFASGETRELSAVRAARFRTARTRLIACCSRGNAASARGRGPRAATGRRGASCWRKAGFKVPDTAAEKLRRSRVHNFAQIRMPKH
jgi:hypothetical protein